MGHLESNARLGEGEASFAFARNATTPALNALSPTAGLWRRPGISNAAPRGNIAARRRGSPATSSRVPTATSAGQAMLAT
jgi:hypothetical protein